MLNTCCICLENKNDKVENICKHSYCRNCIHSWGRINDTCPLCRYKLDKNILNMIIYRDCSLIKSVGIDSIHRYSMENNIGHQPMEIIKGDTPLLSEDETQFIFKMTGFHIKNPSNKFDNNKIFCILKHNIITIGKVFLKEDNKYYLEDGIAIVRDCGTTFPIHPKNRLYDIDNSNKIYLMF